jgi:hypothetical protein
LAALTPSTVARIGGADISTGMGAASAGGDSIPAGPGSYLHVKNANAAAAVVTVTPPAGSGPQGTTITPLALTPSVAATTGDMIYGPFPVYPWADANGNVNFSYSVTASVTVKALTIAQS